MGVPSIGALMLDNVSGSGSDLPHPGSQSSSSTSRISPEAIAQYEKDKARAETAENLFDGINPVTATWNLLLRSRVLKDPFHMFNMFYISVAHGLRLDFCYALRDAMFILDKDDKSRIVAWGASQNPPLSFDDIMLQFGATVDMEVLQAYYTPSRYSLSSH